MNLLLDYNVPVWAIAKVGILFFLLIYIAFSVVVARQIRTMSETLDVEFDEVIKIIGNVHLAVSVVVFVVGLIIL